jgi:hypothetical protein
MDVTTSGASAVARVESMTFLRAGSAADIIGAVYTRLTDRPHAGQSISGGAVPMG